MKKNKEQKTPRNFVAKNVQQTGAGKHVDKKGEKAPRVRQKRNWKKDVSRSLSEQRIVQDVALTDAQKEVLTQTMSAPNPKVASDQVAGKPKHVTARDMLSKYGLVDWDDQAGTLTVTEKGTALMQTENLVDETGELTDEGKKYATDPDAQQPPEAKDSTDAEASPIEDPAAAEDPGAEPDLDMPMESIFMQIAEALNAKEHAEIAAIVDGKKDWADMEHNLRDKLYGKFMDEMPYGTAKARDGDPDEWIFHRLSKMSAEEISKL